MNTCYIVGAGEFYGSFTPDEGDLVIAADGGYDTLRSAGIRCDLLIGDLDSISSEPSETELIRHPVKKDETDMHLSFVEGYKRGYRDFSIYGGTGGREDHTFANISLLLYMRERGCRGKIFGQKNVFTVIKEESAHFYADAGLHFSAFALGADAVGVSIRGLEYECEGITLTPSFPLAVSNRFIGKEACVKVDTGALLIMVEI